MRFNEIVLEQEYIHTKPLYKHTFIPSISALCLQAQTD